MAKPFQMLIIVQKKQGYDLPGWVGAILSVNNDFLIILMRLGIANNLK